MIAVRYATPICLRLDAHFAALLRLIAPPIAGSASAASKAMIATTTRSSTNVNAKTGRRELFINNAYYNFGNPIN